MPTRTVQSGPTTVVSPCGPIAPPNRASPLGSAQFARPPTTLASLSTAMNAHVGLGEGPSDERRRPNGLPVRPDWAVDVTNERPDRDGYSWRPPEHLR